MLRKPQAETDHVIKAILMEIKAETEKYLATSIMLEKNGYTKEANKCVYKAKGLNEAGKIIIKQLKET